MWKFATDRGRQIWEYVTPNQAAESKDKPLPQPGDFDFESKKNKNSSDRLYRAQAIQLNYKELSDDVKLPADDSYRSRAIRASVKGINYYQALQADDGHWPGDYGGPMFLLPGLIFTHYVTGVELPLHKRKEMIRYLFNHQNEDGGWGIHIEAPSAMFGTVLTYVSLRLLGVEASDERLKKALVLIHKEGAYSLPSWGKFWLAVLGLYEWDGVTSLFPELWLLPESLPLHPWRYWCHCRMVYLPMAYVFGAKIVGKITPLIQELRKELYTEPYEKINFASHRWNVSKLDMYTPHSWVLRTLFGAANVLEKVHVPFIRRKALKFMIDYIHAEDDQTKHVNIGPVNKFINMLSVWHYDGPDSARFKAHLARVDDYLWLAEDGMKCQGYNGSQLWDTAFAVQAITESPEGYRFTRCVKKAYEYVEMSQVLEDVDERETYYRHISNGAWPFSTRDHGWPISDCTAEGLKAALTIHNTGLLSEEEKKVTAERMFSAINVILSFQNKDGGWATYELTRGPAWLEMINPAEVFGGIMIDYTYTECSSACVQALVKFRKSYPAHRPNDIARAIARGAACIRKLQRDDGSWIGSWAVCFTYGTWFGIEGLIDAGEPKNSLAIRKACAFLIGKQNADGGWGESFEACVTKQWVSHPDGSQVVNTAWALMALLKAGYEDWEPLHRAAELLMSRQKETGDWDQEGISGVFNGNCMITYTSYRNTFPIWALQRYHEALKALEQQ